MIFPLEGKTAFDYSAQMTATLAEEVGKPLRNVRNTACMIGVSLNGAIVTFKRTT